jgi:hypothetical protein
MFSTYSWEVFSEEKVVNVISASRDILAKGLEHVKKFKNYVIEQYQELNDLDKVTQKFASEM